jgi:membrane fusion protein (multidrug efflux system)
MKNMKKRIILCLVVPVLVLGSWYGWKFHGLGVAAEAVKSSAEWTSKPSPEGGPAPKGSQQGRALPEVVTETAQSGNLTRTMELTGSIAATRLARMASPGEGPVLDCTVWEGDTVKKGERVLSIGRATATQALVVASQAALKEQEQELRRVQQLVKSGAIPGAQLDTARSKYESAKAQVAKARESAEDYSVKAPWDGIVSRILVRDGDYVAPRTPLVELFDPRSLVIRFAVPEAQSMEMAEGMPLTAQLDAYPGKVFHGWVKRIYPELDTRMRTRTAEAILGETVDLVPGMFARLEIILQSISDAVTVPSEAVIVTPRGERTAFVVEEGKGVRRSVETGIEKGGRIQILKGIVAGEEVVVAGNERLKDGAEIQLRARNRQ